MTARPRFLRVLAVAGLMVVAVLGAATTASAHSQLERTDPADGTTIAVLPDQITLTFNQNVLGLGTVVQVTGPDGSAVDGAPAVVDNQVQQPVRPGSPAGDYTVLWRVTSADGHPISGRFAFTATAGSSGTASAATSADAAGTAPSPAEDAGGNSVLIWLLLAGGALVVAAGIFLARRTAVPLTSASPPSASDPAAR
jgi:methionine-rich copper-binding protein CopC